MFNGEKGGRGNAPEKSKNFGAAIKRLFGELGALRILVIISVVFAIAGAICTIVAPNRIAELTDEITLGLIPGGNINMDAVWAIGTFMIILYVS